MKGAPPYIKLIMISLNNDFPIKNKLFISLGGKVEFLLNNKTFLHPYMRLHYRVTKGIGLYLNYEPKLKYFSFSEYFVDEEYIIPVSPVKTQEDYFNLDFGLNYSVIEGVDINLSLFRKDSLNYIYIYDINSDKKEDNSELGLRSISNLSQVTTNGVELSYIYTAIDNFEQSASITYEYISDDTNTISNIPYSPKIKFSAYMRLSPIKQFEFFIDGKYTSNYYSGTSGDLIGGYFLLNLNTTSWIKDKYGIIFGIDNITNKEYFITGDIPGYRRTFFAGFNLLI
jgi:hypothetical protein